MFRGIKAAAFDAFEDVGLRFFAEAVQFGDFAGLAGGLEFFDGIHAEVFIEHLDFFGAKSGNFQQVEQARRR